ncbi:MAG: arginine--tRNA ligase [Alphaproteobacteria bacterium]|nr:arginine--tRNA ligase [Alphaproteobacteria bacterium]
MNINPFISKLEKLFRGAVEIPEGIEIVRPSDRPDLSDFQSNIALALAKIAKANPRQLAEQIMGKIDGNPDFSFKIDGPGFINITLSEKEIEAAATRTVNTPELGFTKTKNPLSIIVDYGGANMGKTLHVGHLRPHILGEATKRLARFVGHNATGDAHIGDWGRPMGLLITAIREEGIDPDALTIEDLNRLYPASSARYKEDAEFAARTNAAIMELQNEEPDAVKIHSKIVETSSNDVKKVIAPLNITLETWWGEWWTIPNIKMLLAKWIANGTVKESDGAWIIETDTEVPFRATNSHGLFLYEMTDVGTIYNRVERFKPDLILYHADIRQRLSFDKVFEVVRKTGIAPATLGLELLGHGMMQGKDGRPFKTRSGDNYALGDFIRDAIKISAENAKSPEDAVAIAVAAIKFADFINPRESDYIFDTEKFLKFEGKTGPYILYTAVRIKSILEKSPAPANAAIKLSNKYDRALAIKLCDFASTVQKAFDQRATNLLATYIFELASAFSAFYHECHISSEENQELKNSWLALSAATLRAIEIFANIIAIDIPKEM